jgi:membrane protein
MNPGSKRQSGPESGSKLQRLRRFIERDIWDFGVGGDRSLQGQLRALVRVLVISARGLGENRLFSRAAALSYASLIALGPLVAIIVFLSGSFVQTDAETQIKRGLLFIAPSLQEYSRVDTSLEADPEMASAVDELITRIVEGAESMLQQVNTGGSKAFGALGALIFIWVVIQLLTTVENTLNQIWGVHKGRLWSQRVVFYWTFVSLGVLLGLGSTALLSASNLATLTDWVPFGSSMANLTLALSPLLSFFMLVLLLTLFYRFFPNTSVHFKPALIGSLLTASLLLLNNFLSILYVHRVISFQSLYGSVGIIPVLMFGLYFFWILILLGGQLTYAVQNVSYLTTRSAWITISPRSRKLLTLAAFTHIARRFRDCEPPPTIHDISSRFKVPTNLLNESASLLEKMGWITRVAIEGAREEAEGSGFRPSRPLETYTPAAFQSTVERDGQSGAMQNLPAADPILKAYTEALDQLQGDTFWETDMASLLVEHPLDDSSEADPHGT